MVQNIRGSGSQLLNRRGLFSGPLGKRLCSAGNLFRPGGDVIRRIVDLAEGVAEGIVDAANGKQNLVVVPNIALTILRADTEVSVTHLIQQITDILNDRPQVFRHSLEGLGELPDFILRADVQVYVQVTGGDLVSSGHHSTDRNQHFPEDGGHNQKKHQQRCHRQNKQQACGPGDGGQGVRGIHTGHGPPGFTAHLQGAVEAGDLVAVLAGLAHIERIPLGHGGLNGLQLVGLGCKLHHVVSHIVQCFAVPYDGSITAVKGRPHGGVIVVGNLEGREGTEVDDGDDHTNHRTVVNNWSAVGDKQQISIPIGGGNVNPVFLGGDPVGVLFGIFLVGGIGINLGISRGHVDIKPIVPEVALELIGLKHDADALQLGVVFDRVPDRLHNKLLHIVCVGGQGQARIKGALLHGSGVPGSAIWFGVNAADVFLDTPGRIIHNPKAVLDLCAGCPRQGGQLACNALLYAGAGSGDRHSDQKCKDDGQDGPDDDRQLRSQFQFPKQHRFPHSVSLQNAALWA